MSEVASSMIGSEVAKEGAKLLAPFHRETKLALGMLGLVLLAGWYVADVAIPKALEIINLGHAARDDAHSRDLDKVVAAFRESNDQNQKHNREMIDVIKESLKPIAVNPLGGGS